jgi:hypothetical protein
LEQELKNPNSRFVQLVVLSTAFILGACDRQQDIAGPAINFGLVAPLSEAGVCPANGQLRDYKTIQYVGKSLSTLDRNRNGFVCIVPQGGTWIWTDDA